jgi:hypothetical protein
MNYIIDKWDKTYLYIGGCSTLQVKEFLFRLDKNTTFWLGLYEFKSFELETVHVKCRTFHFEIVGMGWIMMILVAFQGRQALGKSFIIYTQILRNLIIIQWIWMWNEEKLNIWKDSASDFDSLKAVGMEVGVNNSCLYGSTPTKRMKYGRSDWDQEFPRPSFLNLDRDHRLMLMHDLGIWNKGVFLDYDFHHKEDRTLESRGHLV